jgi:hypothetical protein
MPGIKFDVIWDFKNFCEVTTGGAFIYSYDINDFEEFSTTSDPDPDEQRRPIMPGRIKLNTAASAIKSKGGLKVMKQVSVYSK